MSTQISSTTRKVSESSGCECFTYEAMLKSCTLGCPYWFLVLPVTTELLSTCGTHVIHMYNVYTCTYSCDRYMI